MKHTVTANTALVSERSEPAAVTAAPAAKCCVWDARGNGTGGVVPTLTGDHQNRVTDYTAICVSNGQLHQTDMGDKTGALNCMHDQQAVVACSGDVSSTLDVSYYKGTGARNGKEREFVAERKDRKYIIRHLTPLECCRLQGFPDWWENGVEGSDSARYKMWGNGMALPNMLFVMQGIARMEEGEIS